MLIELAAILGLAVACVGWGLLARRAHAGHHGCEGCRADGECGYRREEPLRPPASHSRQDSSKVSGESP